MREASKAVVWPRYLQCRCRCRLSVSSTANGFLIEGWTTPTRGVDDSVLGLDGVGAGGSGRWTTAGLFFAGLSSFMPSSVDTLRFLGCAFSTNVQSCLWNCEEIRTKKLGTGYDKRTVPRIERISWTPAEHTCFSVSGSRHRDVLVVDGWTGQTVAVASTQGDSLCRPCGVSGESRRR